MITITKTDSKDYTDPQYSKCLDWVDGGRDKRRVANLQQLIAGTPIVVRANYMDYILDNSEVKRQNIYYRLIKRETNPNNEN